MSKYNSELEVLYAIREKFATRKHLGRKEVFVVGDDGYPQMFSSCMYSHSAGDGGCAVGCLLSARDAEGWTAYKGSLHDISVLSDSNFYHYFGPGVPLHFLWDIQGEHDRSKNVEEFRCHLDELIVRRGGIVDAGIPVPNWPVMEEEVMVVNAA